MNEHDQALVWKAHKMNYHQWADVLRMIPSAESKECKDVLEEISETLRKVAKIRTEQLITNIKRKKKHERD